MRTSIATAALLAGLSVPLASCANGGLLGGNERVYNPGVVRQAAADNNRIYRDEQGNFYCKRENGTTGTLVGAGVGGVLGNIIAPGESKTIGTILGVVGGAVAGRAIDRSQLACK